LAGLLRARAGICRAAYASWLGDPDAAAARLAVEAPLPVTPPGGSRNYRAILAGAKVSAKSEGAAFASELHLLASFLDLRSSALDGALRSLGTTRDAVRDAIVRLAPNLPPPPGDSSVSLPPGARP
jgi:hypothetical protein